MNPVYHISKILQVLDPNFYKLMYTYFANSMSIQKGVLPSEGRL